MVKDTSEWLAARDIYLDMRDNQARNFMLMGEQVIQAAAAFMAARVLLLAEQVEKAWLAVAVAVAQEGRRVLLAQRAVREAKDFTQAAAAELVGVETLKAAVQLAAAAAE
jgi:hypothetical protein